MLGTLMKRGLFFASLLGALFIAACGSGGSGSTSLGASTSPPTASGPPAEIWETLRERPLQLPNLASGAACPRTPDGQVSPAYGPGLGTGPIYPVGLGTNGVLSFAYPPDPSVEFAGSDWGGAKVLWVSSPAYRGPALIRGHQLDGPNGLRFGRGIDPSDELRLPQEPGARSIGEEPGWRAWPSYTRLRAPGCYAYQVDGLDFTEVVVFRTAEEAE